MAKKTNNGKKGGLLHGKPHSRGGIQAVVTDTDQPVELEGGEVIINKEASKRHWKELSRINQSAGGGVPILPPNNAKDADIYGKGGVITYKNRYNKRYGYPLDQSHTLSQIAKDTGRSLKGLQQIYNKGIGAYKTNPQSVRPNVKSKEQWAMARVYSAVMGGKASRVDKHELAMAKGGGIPERYRNMGFDRVGQKKDSTNPQKKWMVLAKKGDQYKVVHGGYKGMQDFSQHQDTKRRERFWNRMGGKDSAKANDPFSPLYWHKKFGTWEKGGNLNMGIEAESEHMATAQRLYNREITPSQAPESIAREHISEDANYYLKMGINNYLNKIGHKPMYAKGGKTTTKTTKVPVKVKSAKPKAKTTKKTTTKSDTDSTVFKFEYNRVYYNKNSEELMIFYKGTSTQLVIASMDVNKRYDLVEYEIDYVNKSYDSDTLILLPYTMSAPPNLVDAFDYFSILLNHDDKYFAEEITVIENGKTVILKWNEGSGYYEQNENELWSRQSILENIVSNDWVLKIMETVEKNDPRQRMIVLIDAITDVPTASSDTATTSTVATTDFPSAERWGIDTNRLYYDTGDESLNIYTLNNNGGLDAKYLSDNSIVYFDEPVWRVEYEGEKEQEFNRIEKIPLPYSRYDFDKIVSAILGKDISGDDYEFIKANGVYQTGTLKGEMFELTNVNDKNLKLSRGLTGYADLEIPKKSILNDVIKGKILITGVEIDENVGDRPIFYDIMPYDEILALPDIDYNRVYSMGNDTIGFFTRENEKLSFNCVDVDDGINNITLGSVYGNPKIATNWFADFKPLPYYAEDFLGLRRTFTFKKAVVVEATMVDEKYEYVFSRNSADKSFNVLDLTSKKPMPDVSAWKFMEYIVKQTIEITKVRLEERNETYTIRNYPLDIMPTQPSTTPANEPPQAQPQPQAVEFDKAKGISTYIGNNSNNPVTVDLNDYFRTVLMNFASAVRSEDEQLAKEAQNLIQKFNN